MSDRLHYDGSLKITQHRRTEGGDRFSHNTVAVLEAFATAILGLKRALRFACDPFTQYPDEWDESAYNWARSAVRAARLLTVREEVR